MIVEGICYNDLKMSAYNQHQLRQKNLSSSKKPRYQSEKLKQISCTRQNLDVKQNVSLLQSYIQNYKARIAKESSSMVDQSALLRSFCEDGIVSVIKNYNSTIEVDHIKAHEEKFVRNEQISSESFVISRPKISITPIELKETLRPCSVYVPKRCMSPNTRYSKRPNTAGLLEKDKQLAKKIKRQMSITNNLMEPCHIQKKAILQRSQVRYRPPKQQTGYDPNIKQCYLPIHYREKFRIIGRGKRTSLGKFDIGAWEMRNNNEQCLAD